MCVIDQGDEGWVVVSQALTLLWSTRIFWQLLCQYSSVGSSKQLKFLAKRLNLIKTVGSVTHPYDSGSQLVQLYSTTKRNSDRPSLLRPTEFMRAYHPAGFSASPAADWHLCISSWSSSGDGWTNTKEMLNGSGGLCPKKPCGSSGGAVRGQKRHGMSQQAARNIPSRGWAQHLLQQDVEQTSAQERFGKEIPFSLRHACSKLWNTTSCGKVTQGRAIASSPMCTWLDTCSSSFFHISMEMTPCLSGRFYFFTKPQ